MNAITRCNTLEIKLTRYHAQLCEEFRELFPDMNLELISESCLNSVNDQQKWQTFADKYREKIADIDSLYLVRSDARSCLKEGNLILATKFKCLVLESVRNKEGVNERSKEQYLVEYGKFHYQVESMISIGTTWNSNLRDSGAAGANLKITVAGKKDQFLGQILTTIATAPTIAVTLDGVKDRFKKLHGSAMSQEFRDLYLKSVTEALLASKLQLSMAKVGSRTILSLKNDLSTMQDEYKKLMESMHILLSEVQNNRCWIRKVTELAQRLRCVSTCGQTSKDGQSTSGTAPAKTDDQDRTLNDDETYLLSKCLIEALATKTDEDMLKCLEKLEKIKP